MPMPQRDAAPPSLQNSVASKTPSNAAQDAQLPIRQEPRSFAQQQAHHNVAEQGSGHLQLPSYARSAQPTSTSGRGSMQAADPISARRRGAMLNAAETTFQAQRPAPMAPLSGQGPDPPDRLDNASNTALAQQASRQRYEGGRAEASNHLLSDSRHFNDPLGPQSRLAKTSAAEASGRQQDNPQRGSEHLDQQGPVQHAVAAASRDSEWLMEDALDDWDEGSLMMEPSAKRMKTEPQRTFPGQPALRGNSSIRQDIALSDGSAPDVQQRSSGLERFSFQQTAGSKLLSRHSEAAASVHSKPRQPNESRSRPAETSGRDSFKKAPEAPKQVCAASTS